MNKKGLIIGIFFIVFLLLFNLGFVNSEILLEDDFETDNDLAKWMHPFNADGSINYDNTHVNSGNMAARMHYYVPSGDPEHRDDNVFLNGYFSESENIEAYNVRGYVYLPFVNHPHDGNSVTWRKLIYTKGHEYSWTQTVSVIDKWDPARLQLTISGEPISEVDYIELQYDQWHCIEMHQTLNTPGESDGVLKVWVDGKLVFEDTSHFERDTDEDYPVKNVEIGRQVDRNGDILEREEYRYWDDIVITDGTYIGCGVDSDNCQDGEEVSCNTGLSGICSEGTKTCSGGSWSECKQDNESTTEICDNGLDDDCDGEVDEGCLSEENETNQTSENTTRIILGNTSESDYDAIEDTFINLNKESPETNENLNTYTWPENSVANAILMKLDLSNLPEDITKVESATLNLYQTESGGDSAYDLSVHRIINHNPTLSEATGYTYDGINNWTAYDGCYNDIPLAQEDIDSAVEVKTLDLNNGYKEFNITSLVNSWLQNSSKNYGLLINSDSVASSDSHRFFASSENFNSSIRPYVAINYSSSTGTIEEIHPADTDENGVVELNEITSYIDKWINGEITIDSLLSGINEWRGL